MDGTKEFSGAAWQFCHSSVGFPRSLLPAHCGWRGGASQGAGTGVKQPVCLAGLPRDVVQGPLGNQFLECPSYLEATVCAVKKKETWKWYLIGASITGTKELCIPFDCLFVCSPSTPP